MVYVTFAGVIVVALMVVGLGFMLEEINRRQRQDNNNVLCAVRRLVHNVDNLRGSVAMRMDSESPRGGKCMEDGK